MSDEAVLSVRGEAILEVDPEIARVAVTIVARDSDRGKALRLLNDRAASVDGLLNGFQGVIDTVETAGVRVSPQLKSRKPQERIAGYVATVRHTITVTDFTRLGDLIAQLADHDLTEVTGPYWALRPASPLHRTARIAATHDAVHRARDYAAALGSHLTALVELADVRLLSDAHGPAELSPMAPAGGLMHTRQAAIPDEFTFDIAPVKQIVQATVEARFRIAQSDLSTIG